MLAGREVFDRDGAFAAIEELVAPGRSVIVTLGGAGVVTQSAGMAPTFTPPKAVEVVSTHGAGGCFIGAFATRIAKGDRTDQAAAFANGVAADFVSRRH